MEYRSVWKKKTKKYPRLEENIERDTVIAGGGIAGYLTAFRLAEAGVAVTLVEADRLFSGTTGRTTAKISSHQGNVYTELFDRYGEHAARQYYRSQFDGIRGFEELVQRYQINCDWRECDGYIFTHDKRCKTERLFQVLSKIGAECEFAQENLAVGRYAVKMGGQYLFDPLKFLSALPVNFEIYESTRVVDIDADRKILHTEGGDIRAKKIIVATHYPIINSHGGYFMKLRQSMSYTLAVKEKYTADMYLDEREDGLSVRPYAQGTLLGGGDHRTGRFEGEKHFDLLEKHAQSAFGEGTVTHEWCAEDVMTFDGMPMAGKYAKNLDDVYVVTGFNKWGMTNAMVCSELLKDMLLGNDNPYAELFSPQRHIKKSFGAFISNALTNVSGIFLGYFRLPAKTAADIPAGRGMIVFHNGKRRAVYRDFSGNLHVIGRMCPHMHCELKWNGDTNTWDCPCHGSRFDVDGNVISEPATKKCKYEKENARRKDTLSEK